MSRGEAADICCGNLFCSFPLFPVVALSLLFHTQPSSVVQKQGSAVHLHCVVHPASATVTWMFQGRALEPGSQRGVEVHPDRLVLPALQPHNTGLYQCVAHSDTGSITSQWARVTIAGEHMDSYTDTLAGKHGTMNYPSVKICFGSGRYFT